MSALEQRDPQNDQPALVDLAEYANRIQAVLVETEKIRDALEDRWVHEDSQAVVLWWGRAQQALDVARSQLQSVMWHLERKNERREEGAT